MPINEIIFSNILKTTKNADDFKSVEYLYEANVCNVLYRIKPPKATIAPVKCTSMTDNSYYF